MKKIFNTLTICTALAFFNSSSWSQEPSGKLSNERGFIGLTFHNVRNDVLKQGDHDLYAISTQNLVQYFEWLHKSKWRPVTLKQIMQAKKNGVALPENSVLITFDDGALSGYSHVFPLLKQYNIPAVFAIVTSWTNGNTKAAYEAYGQGNLMSWDQMREMQKSGLVEFASHSDDLHKGILANPQKNEEPAALTHQYFATENRYESDKEYRDRIFNDLKKSKDILKKELDIDSLAIIWPYGAVNPQVEKIANEAGFPLSFSLGVDSLNHKNDGTFQRGLVMNNPSAEDINEQMTEFSDYKNVSKNMPIRAVGIDLKQLKSKSNDEGNQKLGNALNQISALSSNAVVIQVIDDEDQDGIFDHAYFPTTHLPVAQDLVNRVIWQTRTRVFNRVTAQLPFYPNPNQPNLVLDLAEDLVKNNKGIDGIMLNAAQQLECLFEPSNTKMSSDIETNIDRLSPDCARKFNDLIHLSERTQQRIKPYLNISNSQKFAIQLKYDFKKGSSITQVIQLLKNHYSLINFEIDSIQNPDSFTSFLKQISNLSAHEITSIMVTLDSSKISSDKQWRQLQKDLTTLQTVRIQKMGINDYSFKNASKVHHFLYQPLSLNSNSLLYRDPFQGNLKNGVLK